MVVDQEIRERLSLYPKEKAANQALHEILDRADSDPVMKQRLARAKALQEELETLRQV
jgi:hypothetical protein